MNVNANLTGLGFYLVSKTKDIYCVCPLKFLLKNLNTFSYHSQIEECKNVNAYDICRTWAKEFYLH